MMELNFSLVRLVRSINFSFFVQFDLFNIDRFIFELQFLSNAYEIIVLLHSQNQNDYDDSNCFILFFRQVKI